MATPPPKMPPSTPAKSLPAFPPKLSPAMPKITAPSPVSQRTPKVFSVAPWHGSNEGEKFCLYSQDGMGKTTLAALAPDPIFIGLDDGARKIRHPVTGEVLNAIPGVETFQDLLDVTSQVDLFKSGQTFVLDTITKAEVLAEHHCFATIRTDKGTTATSIEDYGYGKGYKHVLDSMRLLLSRLDGLVHRGVNVVLLAQQSQATISNLEGLDFLQDGPKLTHTKQYSVRTDVTEWVDHVIPIRHQDITVTGANTKATKGKVKGSTDRVLYTQGQLHFKAKNRFQPIGRVPEVISFANQQDDSLWRFAFTGAIV